jgi:hypothetical protein
VWENGTRARERETRHERRTGWATQPTARQYGASEAETQHQHSTARVQRNHEKVARSVREHSSIEKSMPYAFFFFLFRFSCESDTSDFVTCSSCAG